MGEEKGKLQSIREWIVEHKLRTVGNHLFLSRTHIGIKTYGLRLFFWDFFFWRDVVGKWNRGLYGLQLVSTQYENKR